MDNNTDKILDAIDRYCGQIYRSVSHVGNLAVFQTVLLVLILWRVW